MKTLQHLFTFALPLLLTVPRSQADTIVFNTDATLLTVNGTNSATFKGLPYTVSIDADGATLLRLNPGNIFLAASDRFTFLGSRPARLMVQGNLDVPVGALIEADASGVTPGAGGGAGGNGAGTGGAPGAAGVPRGNLPAPGSNGVAGAAGGVGGAIFSGAGGKGKDGTAGIRGGTGGGGGEGLLRQGAAGYGNFGSGGGQILAIGIGGGGGGGGAGATGGLIVPGGLGGGTPDNTGDDGLNGQANLNRGQPGTIGTDGGAGGRGLGGMQLSSGIALSGGGGGGAGQGGGGGGGGGAGGSGGGGAGGGGGQGDLTTGGAGGAGGRGGSAGYGGNGARGRDGGSGGAGGGAFEIVATGRITLSGSLGARGGDGQPGESFSNGDGLSPLHIPGTGPGAAFATNGIDGEIPNAIFGAGKGGKGGTGSVGGNGANGGRGGPSGSGGGGAGGTILIRGNGLTLLPTAQFLLNGGTSGNPAFVDRAQTGRIRFLDTKFYKQDFNQHPNGTREFNDFSSLASSSPSVAGVSQQQLLLTTDNVLDTRSQLVLPRLNRCTFGFTASFIYQAIPPGNGSQTEGFGLYLKPAGVAVDTGNPIGGYAGGLGVEFLTDGTPRHQIRVFDTVLPGAVALAPNGQFTHVLIDYRTAPGQPGTLSVFADGMPILYQITIPATYQPELDSVFAFAARTGGLGQTIIDDIEIRPLTLLPPSNLSIRPLSNSNDVAVYEVKWDTQPNGIYEFYTSPDLKNWTFNRTFTARNNTFAVSSITQPSTQPRLFYRVARQQ
ncbi:MAG: hypothetical protein ACRDBP_09030 [Luteolibacter sp.]